MDSDSSHDGRIHLFLEGNSEIDESKLFSPKRSDIETNGQKNISSQIINYYNTLCEHPVPLPCSKVDELNSFRNTPSLMTRSQFLQNISENRAIEYENVFKINEPWSDMPLNYNLDISGEDISIQPQELENMSSLASNFLTSDSGPKERRRWVRPPLIGQASSNDAGMAKNTDASDKLCLPTEYENKCIYKGSTFSSFKQYEKQEIDLIEDDHQSLPLAKQNDWHSNKSHGDYQGRSFSLDSTPMLYSRDHFVVGESILSQTITHQSPTNTPVDSSVNTYSGVGVRAPSPSSVSSLTSGRRLEWDSGADVGYIQQQYDVGTCGELSTIERIALVRGCSAALHVRMDPEGTTSSSAQQPTLQTLNTLGATQTNNVKYQMKPPMAESTLLERENTEGEAPGSLTGTESESEITPILRQQNSQALANILMNGTRVFFESRSLPPGVQNVEGSNPNSSPHVFIPEKEPFILLTGKHSSSLTNLSVCQQPNTLQRSQSHCSLLDKQGNAKDLINIHIHHLNRHNKQCSVSSSSIATVVHNQHSKSSGTSNKLVQATTAPFRHSVGTQVSDNVTKQSHTSQITNIKEIMKYKSSSVLKQKKNVAIKQRRKPDEPSNHCAAPVSVSITDSADEIAEKDHHTSDPHSSCTGAHKRVHNIAVSQPSCGNTHSETKHTESGYKSESHGQLIPSASHDLVPKTQGVKVVEQFYGTLESVASSTQTAASWLMTDVHGTNGASDPRRESGVVGSAHSFEYLPGHMYETKSTAENSSPQEQVRTTGTEDSSSPVTSRSSTRDKAAKDKFWGSSVSSSLSRDLENGIKQLKNLLDTKQFNSDLKRKLIRRVVNRLVNSNYADDEVPELNLSHGITGQQGYVRECISVGSPQDGAPSETKSREVKSGSVSSTLFTPHRGKKPYTDLSTVEKDAPSETSSSLLESMAPEDTRRGHGCVETCSNMYVTPKDRQHDWRHTLTRSEREFDLRRGHRDMKTRGGVSGALHHFCENERANQLSWIQTEINHLNNLKHLLEKQQMNNFNARNQSRQRSATSVFTIMKVARNATHSSRSVTSITETEEAPFNDQEGRRVHSRRQFESRFGVRQIHSKPLLSHPPTAHTSRSLKPPSVPKDKENSPPANSSKEWSSHHYLCDQDKRHMSTQFPSFCENISLPSKSVRRGSKSESSNKRDACFQVPSEGRLDGTGQLRDQNVIVSRKHSACVQVPSEHEVLSEESSGRRHQEQDQLKSVNNTYTEKYKHAASQVSDPNIQQKMVENVCNVGTQVSGARTHPTEQCSGSCKESSSQTRTVIITPRSSGHTGTLESILDITRDQDHREPRPFDSGRDTPMCCCECRKVLKELLLENKKHVRRKKEQPIKHLPDDTGLKKCFNCGIRPVSGIGVKDMGQNVEFTGNSSSSMASKPINKESRPAKAPRFPERKTVATETVDTSAVQTSSSVRAMPVIRPHWFSPEDSDRRPSKRCPCCFALEEDLEPKTKVSVCRCPLEDTSPVGTTTHQTAGCGLPDNPATKTASKPPIGYILTVESSPSLLLSEEEDMMRKMSLEEIQIKVPSRRPFVHTKEVSGESSGVSSKKCMKEKPSEKKHPKERKLTLQAVSLFSLLSTCLDVVCEIRSHGEEMDSFGEKERAIEISSLNFCISTVIYLHDFTTVNFNIKDSTVINFFNWNFPHHNHTSVTRACRCRTRAKC
uniref:Uncharacterized protein n=1 Tax=Timema poppense TaxID=170557 RepID=A0A7R9H980_TIMPO|nr:unnamed protein product [Timema poppensis]